MIFVVVGVQDDKVSCMSSVACNLCTMHRAHFVGVSPCSGSCAHCHFCSHVPHITILISRAAAPIFLSAAIFLSLADRLLMLDVNNLRLLASPVLLSVHLKLSDFSCGAVSSLLSGIAIAVHAPLSHFDAFPSASGSLTPGVPTPLNFDVKLSASARRSTRRRSAS